MADIVDRGPSPDTGMGDDLWNAFGKINARFEQILGTLSQITWAPGLAITATPARQWTVQGGQAYVATTNHTAGATFAADLAAGRWASLDVAQTIDDLAQLSADLANPLVGPTILGVDPGNGATPTTFDIWVKMQRAVVENFATPQAALNSGARIVRLSEPAYSWGASVAIPSGVTLEGDGKSGTAITCSANITPIVIGNANDAGLEGVLIIAHAAQTAALIALNATTQTIARCRVRDVQGSGAGTDFPFIALAATGGAYGNWAHQIEDVSVSGCGTIFKAETMHAGAWINSVRVSHVHANDFIRGMHLIATAGDGCSDSTFLDWATQSSARTEFGALVADVAVQGTSRKNSFHDVRFYDMGNGDGLSYYIGDNVLDTNISGLIVDSLAPNRIRDKGINTLVNGLSVPDYLMRGGRAAAMATDTGLTEALSGTGSSQAKTAYTLLRTGATLGSQARRYSADPVSGLNPGQMFSTDFGRPLRLSFVVSRITAAATSIARVQYKSTQADGSLAAVGVGVQINNYEIFGESFGTALSVNSLGVVMTDGASYRVDVIVYPGQRVEWWVDGVMRVAQSTASAVPLGTAACYLHLAMGNVATPADAQLLVSALRMTAGS